MKRRDFIKYSAGGLATIAIGSKMGFMNTPAYAASPINKINITVTDALKEMHCFNALDVDPNGTCYFWAYQMEVEFTNNLGTFVPIPVNVPGPTIVATVGDTIPITVTNALTQRHAFFIPGMVDTGPIPANGGTANATITATTAGTFLYHDNRNAPVNRVMGLHGAFVVMPAAKSGTNWTPYSAGQATTQVQALFDDLGTAAWWPGLAWEEGDPVTLTAPFRQYIWITHQASPKLFSEVGDTPGVFSPAQFVRLFRRDAFSRDSFNTANMSHLPNHFTITGQQGHFCHNNPIITPMARVGEPVLVRAMNAGLMTHSMHLHFNHHYIVSVDGVVQGPPVGAGTNNASILRPGVIWTDTMTLNPFGEPCSQYDMVVPYMRAPDIPNRRGIGRGGSPDAGLPTIAGHRTYPLTEEFDVFQPAGGFAKSSIDGVTPVPLAQRQSPMCYPMHDHSEATQTTQGGNYNAALISGAYCIGDRNIALPRVNINDDPAMPLLPPQTFPMDEDFAMMLGLDQATPILAYGIEQAVRTGIMEASKQSDPDLESQADRPDFPPPFVDPAV
jgi:FtsP/CotA-like multicopper oxidase with cupredoxin domain